MKKNLISANEYLNSPKWYIITVISGNEESVAANLKGKIKSYGYDDKVEDVRIIKEKIITIEEFSADNAPSNVGRKSKNIEWKTVERNGKVFYQQIKKEEKNKFSGYIFIKMFMDDEIWFIIRNTQLVTGIVGSSGKNAKPVPISDFEIEKVLNSENYNFEEVNEGNQLLQPNTTDIYKEDNSIIIETITYKADFDVNDLVKITIGSMEGQTGKVVSKNDAKGLAKIEVEIFNSLNTVEVNYNDLKKVE